MRRVCIWTVAVLLSFGWITGCSRKQEAGKAVQTETFGEESEEKEPDRADEKEADMVSGEEASDVEKLLYRIQAEGIDYLSVDEIPVPEGAVIAMVGKDTDSSYWKALRKGAEAAVEQLNQILGYTGNKKVKLLYDAPEKESVEEQIDIIDQMLDKNPDVLCIGFADVNSSRTQLELAEANGIPVLSMDSGIDDELIKCSVQTDNRKAAGEAAMNFVRALGGNGKVALLVHSAETQTGIDREQGFLDALSHQTQYPEAQVAEILYLQENPDDTLEEIRRVTQEYPDLTGWFGTNQICTELLLKAVKDLTPEEGQELPRVGGFDTGETLVKALQNGTLLGTMSQNPYGMGYAVVVAAAREMTGMENAGQVSTGCYWVTAENLGDDLIQEVIYQ